MNIKEIFGSILNFSFKSNLKFVLIVLFLFVFFIIGFYFGIKKNYDEKIDDLKNRIEVISKEKLALEQNYIKLINQIQEMDLKYKEKFTEINIKYDLVLEDLDKKLKERIGEIASSTQELEKILKFLGFEVIKP